MGKNTVHKGIANTGDFDRPMFFCNYSTNFEYDFPELAVDYHENTNVQEGLKKQNAENPEV